MKGHNDTVTSLALSNCGSFVLTNSMDNSLRIWDIRPFVTKERTFIFTANDIVYDGMMKSFPFAMI